MRIYDVFADENGEEMNGAWTKKEKYMKLTWRLYRIFSPEKHAMLVGWYHDRIHLLQ